MNHFLNVVDRRSEVFLNFFGVLEGTSGTSGTFLYSLAMEKVKIKYFTQGTYTKKSPKSPQVPFFRYIVGILWGIQ